MTDKVVFLAYRNDELKTQTRDFMSCKHCSNKTFVLIYPAQEGFPLLQCAACGNHLGRMGWVNDP